MKCFVTKWSQTIASGIGGLISLWILNYCFQWIAQIVPPRTPEVDKIIFSVWVLAIPAWFFIESFLKAKGWLSLDEDMRDRARDFWIAVGVVLAGLLLGRWGCA
jgi:hypothetical protein